MFFSFSFLFLISTHYAASSPRDEADCMISSYSQVQSVVNSCTNITIQDLIVPGGKTLELDLRPGTSLTFKGNTTFAFEKPWSGFMMIIKGSQLNVTGDPGSVLDGQGPRYWDGLGDGGVAKPRFFKIIANDSTISDLYLLNCPHKCVYIVESNDLLVTGFNVDVSAGDEDRLGHNTDGFGLEFCNRVTINNSTVRNQDDCVVFKSGDNCLVSNVDCYGSHGLSVSVGDNFLSNITFINSTVRDSDNGIHVKAHGNSKTGLIANITYKNIAISGIRKYGINVQQNYPDTAQPTNNVPIVGLKLDNVTGSVTGPNSVPVFILCGSSGCSDFNWSGIEVSGDGLNNSCNYEPKGFEC